MTDALTQIAALVTAESGIVGASDGALIGALARTAPDLELTAFLDAVQHGDERRALLLRLVDELTINETYFCRERGQLDAIPWRQLHEAAIARGSGCVRVWSAACSSGEEAYSLAISAWEAFGPETPAVEILGTDIAPSMVLRARGARYRSRSVRELDEGARGRWLVPVGDEWEVVPELRRLVTFGVHNLTHDALPIRNEEKFDLIFCRNVLIYFDRTIALDVAARLRQALYPGGMLVLGSADALGETSHALDEITKTHRARSAPAREPRPLEVDAEAPAVESVSTDADACFLRGVRQLEKGIGNEAVQWFRQALWLDDSFGLAVFGLGRAYDLIGDHAAATRAYRRALRTLGHETRAAGSVHGVAIDDVVAACHARLSVLEAVGWTP